MIAKDVQKLCSQISTNNNVKQYLTRMNNRLATFGDSNNNNTQINSTIIINKNFTSQINNNQPTKRSSSISLPPEASAVIIIGSIITLLLFCIYIWFCVFNDNNDKKSKISKIGNKTRNKNKRSCTIQKNSSQQKKGTSQHHKATRTTIRSQQQKIYGTSRRLPKGIGISSIGKSKRPKLSDHHHDQSRLIIEACSIKKSTPTRKHQ